MSFKEYKVAEVAENIGVSKATIYNKMRSLKDTLKKHIKIKEGIQYIDSKGVEIINNAINLSKEQYTILEENPQIEPEIPEPIEDLIKPETTEPIEVLVKTERNNKYTESLETQIEYLKTIISEKDKQLIAKDLQINDIAKIVENSQFLQKQQHDTILLLEDSETKAKKSFWDRFRSK